MGEKEGEEDRGDWGGKGLKGRQRRTEQRRKEGWTVAIFFPPLLLVMLWSVSVEQREASAVSNRPQVCYFQSETPGGRLAYYLRQLLHSDPSQANLLHTSEEDTAVAKDTSRSQREEVKKNRFGGEPRENSTSVCFLFVRADMLKFVCDTRRAELNLLSAVAV